MPQTASGQPRTTRLLQGRARKRLRRLGYTMDQSYAVVDDAVGYAVLLQEAQP